MPVVLDDPHGLPPEQASLKEGHPPWVGSGRVGILGFGSEKCFSTPPPPGKSAEARGFLEKI